MIGTIHVLQASHEHGAKVVFSSTGGAIYGECERPATEDDPLEPLSPYGTAKLAAESYVSMWNRLDGTARRLRYANVYGPRQVPAARLGSSRSSSAVPRRRAAEDIRGRRPDARLRLRRRRRPRDRAAAGATAASSTWAPAGRRRSSSCSTCAGESRARGRRDVRAGAAGRDPPQRPRCDPRRGRARLATEHSLEDGLRETSVLPRGRNAADGSNPVRPWNSRPPELGRTVAEAHFVLAPSSRSGSCWCSSSPSS